MAEHRLPVELIQHVLEYTEVEPFACLRSTSSTWRVASNTRFILKAKMCQLPVVLPTTAEGRSLEWWSKIFDIVSEALMLQLRHEISQCISGSTNKCIVDRS